MIQLPNESVYSILARLKLLNGFSSPSALNQEIFKKGKKRIHSFIPSSLNAIAAYLEINVTQLIQNHTLFPVYSYFLSKDKSKALFASMIEGIKCVPTNVIDSKSNLSTRYTFNFCPICVQKDIDTYGIPYWHIDQQLPGLNVCSEHNYLLIKVAGGEHGICNKYELPFRVHPVLNHNERQLEFSIFCRNFIEWIKNTNHINRKDIYCALLNHLNLIKGKSSLDMQKLNNQYLSEKQIEQIGFLGAIKFSQAMRILRHPELDYHPAKHLAILFLLCGSFEYLKKVIENDSDAHKLDVDRKKISNETAIVNLYKRGYSVNKISKKLVVSRTMVKRILKATGNISLSLLESKVCSLGQKGIHRSEIANKLNISVGYVEQILSMSANLTNIRKRLIHQQKEKRYKKALKEYLILNPNSVRKDIKKQLNKEFFWLYKHCRIWLENNLPKPLHPVPPRR